MSSRCSLSKQVLNRLNALKYTHNRSKVEREWGTMKGTIKHYLSAMALFMIITGTALALVGDVGEYDLYIEPEQSLSGIASENSFQRSSSIEEIGSVGSYIPYQEGPSTQLSGRRGYPDGYKKTSGSIPISSSSSESTLYQAPWTSGPVEDRLTADVLGLTIPQAESYTPDESLSFVPYSMPKNTASRPHAPEGSAMAG